MLPRSIRIWRDTRKVDTKVFVINVKSVMFPQQLKEICHDTEEVNTKELNTPAINVHILPQQVRI